MLQPRKRHTAPCPPEQEAEPYVVWRPLSTTPPAVLKRVCTHLTAAHGSGSFRAVRLGLALERRRADTGAGCTEGCRWVNGTATRAFRTG